MVSAELDTAGNPFVAMKIDIWQQALEKTIKMLPLLSQSFHEGSSDEPSSDVAENEEKKHPSHARLQELFVSFVEKLDDELYKALQFTVDVYGAEYQEILANSSKFLVLLKRVMHYLEDTKQSQQLGTISGRLLDQIYYKPDVLNRAVYEATYHTAPEEEKELWLWPEDSRAFIGRLCRYVQ